MRRLSFQQVCFFGAIFASIGLHFRAAEASDGLSVHHLAAAAPYARHIDGLSAVQKQKLRAYLDYEIREPCQNYRPPPEPFIRKGCDLALLVESKPTASAAPQKKPLRVAPDYKVTDYKINFDFDSYDIRPDEMRALEEISREVMLGMPYEVLITGYADRSGSENYNLSLSRRRAHETAQTLTGMGVPPSLVRKQAYGESAPAVPTADGVRLEANRRVEMRLRHRVRE